MTIRQRVPRSWVPAIRETMVRTGRATSRWRMDPSFIVIGGQRCGTTSLFKALEQHPQAVRPPVDKGTDYYTLHYDQGREWYRSRFPLGVTSRRRAAHVGAPRAFEACTYYMFHPFAIERLARDFPDIKLVVMLRDPVERAYSAYKHELARRFESEHDFMRALELEDSRLEGQVDRMRENVAYESLSHRHHAYRRRGQFAEQLDRVYTHFAREQVHVLDSEAFFAEPQSEYHHLVTFLSLAEWQPAAFEVHNARPSSSMPDDARSYLREHFKVHDERLADLLGRRPSWAQL